MTDLVRTLPAWAREIDLALPITPQILLRGNVRDLFPVATAGGEALFDLTEMLWHVCEKRGFAGLLVVDPANDHVTVRADDQPLPEGVQRLVHSPVTSAEAVAKLVTAVVSNQGRPVGLVFLYAARLAPVDSSLEPAERALLARAEALGHQAQPVPEWPDGPTMAPYNTVFWVCERQEDLHRSFALGSPALRMVTVPRPTLDVRAAAARPLFALDGIDDDPRVPKLAEVTHGMTVRDVHASGRLALDRELPLDRYADVARLLQIGITDDPWTADQLRGKIEMAEEYLNQRVMGQPAAVRKVVDILMRSAVGLNGAHLTSSPGRPRGVVFLAGPTGVGKTELAKGIASLVLGEDAQPLRFDMSEFRADEAHQRLVGAPPGYVGHDAGGELTNAVRANPVCVLLFDEIDKAHERIFDLFLQILEDGRLTDGRGATVYFTECFLVFTSNIGVVDEAAKAQGGDGARVTHTMASADVERLLREAFVDFFNKRLGRPELRNRFGDNYVVLDYIRPHISPHIVSKALNAVVARVARAQHMTLRYSDDVVRGINDLALSRLADGGRGIGTMVESVIVNPLGRWLFQHAVPPGSVLTIEGVVNVDDQWSLEVTWTPA